MYNVHVKYVLYTYLNKCYLFTFDLYKSNLITKFAI